MTRTHIYAAEFDDISVSSPSKLEGGADTARELTTQGLLPRGCRQIWTKT